MKGEVNEDIKKQNKVIYNSLVLSGGGIKGLAYIGVLKKLEEKDIVKDIKNFAGCSIGAFSCMLIILGYKYSTLEQIMGSYDMTKLNYPSINCIVNHMSLDEGFKLEQFIKTFIHNSGFDKEITMKELYEKTNKILAVTATDIMSKKEIFIDYKNFPNIPVYLAVKISMSIPFVYKPVLYKNKYYCDGYLSCNFPCNYITKETIDDKQVLCFYFTSFIDDTPVSALTSSDIANNIVKTPMFIIQQYNIEYAKKMNFNLCPLKIPKNIHNLKFDLNKKQKAELYDIGYNSAL